jgi:hypothetical protein
MPNNIGNIMVAEKNINTQINNKREGLVLTYTTKNSIP